MRPFTFTEAVIARNVIESLIGERHEQSVLVRVNHSELAILHHIADKLTEAVRDTSPEGYSEATGADLSDTDA